MPPGSRQRRDAKPRRRLWTRSGARNKSSTTPPSASSASGDGKWQRERLSGGRRRSGWKSAAQLRSRSRCVWLLPAHLCAAPHPRMVVQTKWRGRVARKWLHRERKRWKKAARSLHPEVFDNWFDNADRYVHDHEVSVCTRQTAARPLPLLTQHMYGVHRRLNGNGRTSNRRSGAATSTRRTWLARRYADCPTCGCCAARACDLLSARLLQLRNKRYALLQQRLAADVRNESRDASADRGGKRASKRQSAGQPSGRKPALRSQTVCPQLPVPSLSAYRS